MQNNLNSKEEYVDKQSILLNVLIEKIDKLDYKLENHMQNEADNVSILMETFNTAKHVVWFIKWVAVIASAIGLTWAWVYNHFTIGVK